VHWGDYPQSRGVLSPCVIPPATDVVKKISEFKVLETSKSKKSDKYVYTKCHLLTFNRVSICNFSYALDLFCKYKLYARSHLNHGGQPLLKESSGKAN
jgi:hypothetical protein